MDTIQPSASWKVTTSHFVLLLCRPYILCALLALALPFAVVQIRTLGEQTAGLHARVGVSNALWLYSFVCCISMWWGYRRIQRCAAPELQVRRDSRRIVHGRVGCIILSLVGLAVLLLSASEDYFSRVLGVVQAGATDAGMRYDADSPFAGTVPGVFRMFAYLPSAALVLHAAMGTVDKKYAGSKRFAVTACFLFGLLAIKSVLSLSRVELFCGVGTLLAVAAVWLAASTRSRRHRDVVILGAIVTVAGLCSAMVARAVELVRGITLPDRNPMLEYVDIGIANAELALRTCSQHAFGFETFLHVLRYANRYFGGVAALPEAQTCWILNPAQNLLGASLLDAGLFGFLVFVFYGLVFGAVSRKAFVPHPSLHWVFAYLSLLWGVFSVWQVPLIRAPDYWASFGAAFAVAVILDRANQRSRSRVGRRLPQPTLARRIGVATAAAPNQCSIRRRF